jgi:hypothetical protein
LGTRVALRCGRARTTNHQVTVDLFEA